MIFHISGEMSDRDIRDRAVFLPDKTLGNDYVNVNSTSRETGRESVVVRDSRQM